VHWHSAIICQVHSKAVTGQVSHKQCLRDAAQASTMVMHTHQALDGDPGLNQTRAIPKEQGPCAGIMVQVEAADSGQDATAGGLVFLQACTL
jgi:hypothetical protein